MAGKSIILDIKTRANTAGLDKTNQALSVSRRRLRSLEQFAQGFVLQQAGRKMMDAGKAIFSFAKDAVDAAMEFDHGMRLVNTQAHLTNSEFADLQSRTLELARTVTPSMEELNTTLYDIFSSVDLIGNRAQSATGVLKLFATAATASNSPIQDIARGAIQMVNAFGMTANIKNFNKVLDVQFRLVERGIGNVGEFVKAQKDIGPVAKATGQKIESIAASWAFMTKQGYNAAVASTAVARGMQLLGRPESIAKMRKVFDVEMIDKATGQYRDFNDVIVELGKKLQGVPGPKKIEMLQQVFGKTRQHMIRFILSGTNNFKALALEQKLVTDNQGAMKRAFEKMKDADIVKYKIAMNNFRVAMMKVGIVLMPIAAKIIGFFSKLADWFNDLSPGMKKFIAHAGLVVGAILLISGAIFTAMGAFLVFKSMLTITGLSMMGMLGPMIAVVAGVTALVLAVILTIKHWKRFGTVIAAALIVLGGPILQFIGFALLIIKYWKPIKRFFIALWKAVVEAFHDSWEAIQRAWGSTVRFFKDVWVGITSAFKTGVDAVVGFLKGTWSGIVGIFKPPIMVIAKIFRTWWDVMIAVVRWVWPFIVNPIKMAFEVIKTSMFVFYTVVSTTWKVLWVLIKGVWDVFWAAFGPPFKQAWHLLVEGLKILWSIVKTIWQGLWDTVRLLWNAVGRPLIIVIKAAWDGFVFAVRGAWNILKKAWDLFWGALKAVWLGLGKPFVNALKTIWNGVSSVWASVWGTIRKIFVGVWETIRNVALSGIIMILSGLELLARGMGKVTNLLRKIPVVGGLIPNLTSAANALSGLIGTLKAMKLPTVSAVTGGGAGSTTMKGGTQMAAGGILRPRAGGWQVTAAEAGKPEAIIPLNARGAAFLARSFSRAFPHTEGRGQGVSRGGNTYHIEAPVQNVREALIEIEYREKFRGY